MRLDDIKAGIVKWRGLLIISALVSLCLSDGVGPRFMPLPASLVVTASVEGYQGPYEWTKRATLPLWQLPFQAPSFSRILNRTFDASPITITAANHLCSKKAPRHRIRGTPDAWRAAPVRRHPDVISTEQFLIESAEKSLGRLWPRRPQSTDQGLNPAL